MALRAEGLTFLAWPLLAAPDYETTSFDGHVTQFVDSVGRLGAGELTPFLFEWFLFTLMVGLWLWHRTPPLPYVIVGLRRATRR